MKILGIDPGLGTIGFGLIEVNSPLLTSPHPTPSAGGCLDPAICNTQWGVITTTPKALDGIRLEELFTDLHELVKSFSPDVVALEKLFYFRNVTTMLPVSQARGVILLVLQQHRIPVFEYTPLQVKQMITGYGKASKGDIQIVLMDLLGLEKRPTPDDAAGLALALCYHHTEGKAEAMRLYHGQQATR
jgi:crossover junction endodeoxyribonuclease RuvC